MISRSVVPLIVARAQQMGLQERNNRRRLQAVNRSQIMYN